MEVLTSTSQMLTRDIFRCRFDCPPVRIFPLDLHHRTTHHHRRHTLTDHFLRTLTISFSLSFCLFFCLSVSPTLSLSIHHSLPLSPVSLSLSLSLSLQSLSWTVGLVDTLSIRTPNPPRTCTFKLHFRGDSLGQANYFPVGAGEIMPDQQQCSS